MPAGEVIAGVTVQLLGQVQVRQLTPTPAGFGFAQPGVDHIGQNGRAQALDAGHGIGLRASADPLLFER